MGDKGILLVHCKDVKGIVNSVAEFIFKYNGNITRLDEHVDKKSGTFFMRVEWAFEESQISQEEAKNAFQNEVANKFNMTWRLFTQGDKQRAAIFVSKLNHCLFDILSNVSSGAWNLDIPLIISNHELMKEVADKFGIDYYHLPITKDNKQEQEVKQLKLMKEYKIDFVVLARYMQVISGDFIERYKNRIINIHHSFLPAFPGAKPYHSAYERGVKIIGATGHYVTEELDAGPIIEQDVIRVTHKDSVSDLLRKGRELETVVLSRAIWQHINRNVIVYGNKTIIFD